MRDRPGGGAPAASDTQVSLTRECRALPLDSSGGAAPGEQTKAGELEIGGEATRRGDGFIVVSASRGDDAAARVSVRHGASKGGASAQLELAVRDGAAGEAS